ncbi:MAG TPA: ATP-binding protein [Candidatus Binataceae bacterium]
MSQTKTHRQPDDAVLTTTPEELETIRQQLNVIEESLKRIFGPIYSREPASLESRAMAADLIDSHFDGIRDQWMDAVETIMGRHREKEELVPMRSNMSNSLIRLIGHLRDPDDIATYVYLRRHCQEGMLAQAKPSQFNTIHIALKQIILEHVRAKMRGSRMERVRDVVVASIDERRLMVSQFYIESREAALRASEEKYRNSINQSADLIYEIEPGTWKLIGYNAAAEGMHKLEEAEAGHSVDVHIGTPLVEMVPPEYQGEVLKHLQRVVENGSDLSPDWPLGPYFFDVNSALIRSGNKEFIQMVLRDVTHRREMMDTLLKTERLATAGTFSAGVAHEVNNPLASISSLVQSLLIDEPDEQRRQTLHTILSQITRISGTLKDLVNFARPAIAHHQVVEVNALITETLRLVTYNKRFNGVKLEPQLASDLKPAFADDNEIQQVLLNLLFNAADAMHQREGGGTITVITKNKPAIDGDRVMAIMIKIVDNGIGIARENLERVFDPFFTTKPSGAGVGLGLSLCQRIILANHGRIRIESEVGKGTAVTIFLPAHEEAAHPERPAAIQ